MAWRDGGQIDSDNIQEESRRIRRHRRDVFLFFDNDAKVYAPRDAMRLMELLEEKDFGNG